MANLKKRARDFSILAATLTAALAFSSCGSHMPYLIAPPAKHEVQNAATLTGTFTTSDNKVEDLADDTDKPTIVIFGQDTCQACGEEAKRIISTLHDPAHEPGKIHLFTLLVGAIPEDAADWKDLHKVPWTVGIDPKSVLFKQYCPDQTVPCEIVFVPQKGIVMRQTGPADNDTLKHWTGPWEEGDLE